MNFEQQVKWMWDSGRTDEDVTDYLDNLMLELLCTYYARSGDWSPDGILDYLVNECGVADWRASEVVATQLDGGE